MITSRIDNVTNIPEAYRSPVCPPPSAVKIELNAACNLRCSFCNSYLRLRDKKEMSWGMFTSIIDQMRDAGIKEAGLFYLGESTLLPWLPDAISYAKERIPYVFLTTNGTALNSLKLYDYFRAGLDSLKFSVNYSDSEQFAEIAQVKPALYQRLMDALKMAREIRDDVEAETGHRCGLYASHINYDGEQGEKMQPVLEYARQYMDEVYALPLYGQAGPQESPLKGKQWVGGNPGRVGNLRSPVPCWSAFREGHITFDGKMSACCWDHTDALEMADLNEVTLADGWNSEKYQSLRKSHLSEDLAGTPCAKCVLGN